MNALPDETSAYHGTVGEVGDAAAGRAFGDPEVGRLHVRIDGPLAGHDHIDELVAALTDLLSAHVSDPWTPLHFELDDDALGAPGAALPRPANEGASPALPGLVHDHVAKWLAANSLAPDGRGARRDSEAAE